MNPEDMDRPFSLETTTEPTGHPVVLAEDLYAGYGGRMVVQGFSLALYVGQSLAVVGSSGCGKSTLLRCLTGLLRPERGRAEVLGVDMWASEPEHRNRVLQRVGLIFQQGALLGSLSVRDNLALPLEMHTRLPKNLVDRLVSARLAQVGLSDAAWLKPAELSGGMRKRVAVARALMAEPDVLLCDEPTAGLDPVVAAGIDELLAEIHQTQQTAMLVVSHDLASVQHLADRVLMMDDGKLVADGTFEQLAASNEPAVRAFFQREAKERSTQFQSLREKLSGTLA